MGGFRLFNRRYLRKHFHTVAIHREALDASGLASQDAMVLYANHASWWDPLAALYVAERVFPKFRLYAPIDAAAFEKYRMFGQMGFFPVEQHSLRGAASFLKTSRQLLREPGASLWITPQGRFADVRDNTAELQPGISHLAASLALEARRNTEQARPRVWFVPAALEYTFWEERLPELLIWMGVPICVSAEVATQEMDRPGDKQQWHRRLSDHLRSAQSELSVAATGRDASRFEVLLRSRSGTFFVYDWWRWVKAAIRGQRAELDHSRKLARK